MHSVAPDFVVTPLTHVRVVENALPDSEPILAALDPLPVVSLSMEPGIMALAVRLVVHESSLVDVTGLISFISLTISFVSKPLSFIDSAVLGGQHAKAFSLPFSNVQLTSINSRLISLDNKIFLVSQSLIIKYVRDHLVFGGD